jgi:glycosyltransferase involved in cell wall biosynthesis
MIDVCLLLEGTYPYVAGGVSTWVHQLITAMKDIRFAIVTISPNSDPTRSPKYDVPPHVLSLKEVNLHDYDLDGSRMRDPEPPDFTLLERFYRDLIREDYSLFPEFLRLFRGETSCFDTVSTFSSKGIWDLLVRFYDETARGVSFLDYFWTWRGTHLPILEILKAELPPAKIYHAVSTGYAGLLGAIAKTAMGGKFFLTEHGIYTHERALEISQANWIYEREKHNFRAESELSFFKKWWIEIFKVMSHLSYRYADRIFTLYEGNRFRQVLEGADPEKITIVPNGIDLGFYLSIEREKRPVPQIGFIGRVVPIKDVKTFLLSAKHVLEELPEARFLILGPVDEEEDYYEECRALAESHGLEQSVLFTGRVELKEYYKFLDLVVLTSVSEAQPYVILEANLAGIPVVATDVGACREMLEGRTPGDRALGPSGIVTQVANPRETAAAILKLLRDAPAYEAMGIAGRERVRRYYDQDDLLSRYLNIYEKNLY